MTKVNRFKIKMLIRLKKLIRRLAKAKASNVNLIAKSEQMKRAAILLGVFGLSFGYYLYSTSDSKTVARQKDDGFDSVFTASFNKNTDEALISVQQHELNELKHSLKEHKEDLQKTTDETQKEALELENHKTMFQEMQARLNQLELENKRISEELQTTLVVNTANKSDQDTGADSRKVFENRGFETVRFGARTSKEETRTRENYVWAGTFAEGYLLTGIMGDAGINGSKNMGTALIRLTSNGIMPNDKTSRLLGCFALVSTYGDLSANSVVLHLETLSCAGHVINFEQKVYGSVFDLDAMQDLRGTPILKTKPLLTYAAAASILSGIGAGLENYGTAQSINSNGSIMTFSPTNMVRSAGGSAMATPANKIADYVMKIADIYHPLVVARAGRRVSILFTKGFWIDKAHQVFESGKSIDDASNQNQQVTTTYSHASEAHDLPQNTAKSIFNNADNENLQSSLTASNQTSLFSSIQPGDSHP